jgi:hypothetical protein
MPSRLHAPIFSRIEEELHDARRVHSYGQEEDLRSALIMVINRVSELVSLSFDDLSIVLYSLIVFSTERCV